MTKEVLEKAASALLKMYAIPHKRPLKPSKKELERKFKMTTNGKGEPAIQEEG